MSESSIGRLTGSRVKKLRRDFGLSFRYFHQLQLEEIFETVHGVDRRYAPTLQAQMEAVHNLSADPQARKLIAKRGSEGHAADLRFFLAWYRGVDLAGYQLLFTDLRNSVGSHADRVWPGWNGTATERATVSRKTALIALKLRSAERERHRRRTIPAASTTNLNNLFLQFYGLGRSEALSPPIAGHRVSMTSLPTIRNALDSLERLDPSQAAHIRLFCDLRKCWTDDYWSLPERERVRVNDLLVAMGHEPEFDCHYIEAVRFLVAVTFGACVYEYLRHG